VRRKEGLFIVDFNAFIANIFFVFFFFSFFTDTLQVNFISK